MQQCITNITPLNLDIILTPEHILHRLKQKDGHGIVDDPLAEEYGVELGELAFFDYGQGGDGVGGTEDGRKHEALDAREADVVGQPGDFRFGGKDQEAGEDHHGDEGAEDAQAEDDAQVFDEVAAAEGVAGGEDHGRQQEIEEIRFTEGNVGTSTCLGGEDNK